MDYSNDNHRVSNTFSAKFSLGLVNILGGLVFGYCTGIIASAEDSITADWGKLSSGVSGLITASIILGAAIGSLTGGLLCDKIGRQKSAIIMSLGVVVFSLAEAASPFLSLLLVTRVCLGYFLGLISVVCPLYVSEMSPVESRGTLGSLFQVALTFGILIAYGAGFVLQPSIIGDETIGWRIMFMFGSFPALILLYQALFSFQESAVWLSSQGSKEQREPLLKSINSDSPQTITFLGPFAGPVVQGWRGLFSKGALFPLIIGLVLAIDLQATGINGIVFYLPKLLQTAGLGNLSKVLTICVGAWNFLSTFFALFLVDRAGRKPLLFIGTVIMATSLAFVGVAFYAFQGQVRAWLAFAAILLFHTGFEIGPGTLFWIVIAEIFPTGVRSEANGFINLVQNLLNLMVCLLFPIVFKVAQGGIFFFFAALAVLASIFIFFVYKETKYDSPLQMLTIQQEGILS